MSLQNAWGAPVAAAAAPVKLHDVMDEELAAKLQREEEEQWERDIAAQFGDRENVGWCFVEVPSTDSEFGVMSVVQQEVLREEPSGDPNDPDYAFALELQAQEADEYDRLRRQEASSMERIQVMQQGPPLEPKHGLPQCSFRPNGSSHGTSRSRRPIPRYSSAGEFAVHLEEEYEYDSDHGHHHHHANGDHHGPQRFDDDDDDEEELFLEDDLPIANFNALNISLHGPPHQRKRRNVPATSSSSRSTSSSRPNSHSASSSSHHHQHAHHSRS
jgi:hypothetical protein